MIFIGGEAGNAYHADHSRTRNDDRETAAFALIRLGFVIVFEISSFTDIFFSGIHGAMFKHRNCVEFSVGKQPVILAGSLHTIGKDGILSSTYFDKNTRFFGFPDPFNAENENQEQGQHLVGKTRRESRALCEDGPFPVPGIRFPGKQVVI